QLLIQGLETIRLYEGAALSIPDRPSTSIAGIYYGNAASLPRKCGVNIPYTINPSTKCTKYVSLAQTTAFTSGEKLWAPTTTTTTSTRKQQGDVGRKLIYQY
ncbi:hypothetical protein C5167_025320, partial [Papaver somniferum]